jgi:hypothetical protein
VSTSDGDFNILEKRKWKAPKGSLFLPYFKLKGILKTVHLTFEKQLRIDKIVGITD